MGDSAGSGRAAAIQRPLPRQQQLQEEGIRRAEVLLLPPRGTPSCPSHPPAPPRPRLSPPALLNTTPPPAATPTLCSHPHPHLLERDAQVDVEHLCAARVQQHVAAVAVAQPQHIARHAARA